MKTGDRRKQARRIAVRSELLVEICKGVTVRAKVVDESVDGGAGLVFETFPDLSVDSIVTVWFRQTPTKAIVKYVVKQPDGYRVGVQWCGENCRQPARPFGSNAK